MRLWASLRSDTSPMIVSSSVVTLGQINPRLKHAAMRAATADNRIGNINFLCAGGCPRLVLGISDAFSHACVASGCQPCRWLRAPRPAFRRGRPRRETPTCLGATGQAVVIGSSSSMAGSGRVHPDWASASLNSKRRGLNWFGEGAAYRADRRPRRGGVPPGAGGRIRDVRGGASPGPGSADPRLSIALAD